MSSKLNSKLNTSKRTRPLSRIEFNFHKRRVDEINEILDLCSDRDSDVIDNLNRELDEIGLDLEQSLLLISMSKLKLIRSE